MATLKDDSIEFEMVWAAGDLDFVGVRSAFLNRTAIKLAFLDVPVTAVFQRIAVAINFYIRKLKKSQVFSITCVRRPCPALCVAA